MLTATLIAAVGCPIVKGKDTGDVEVALTAIAGSTTYVLDHASFVVAPIEPGDSGIGNTVLTETDPSAGSLKATLAVGRYAVTLSDGWEIERMDSPTGLVPVHATLQSANPVTIEVVQGKTSSVSFQFQTDGVPLTFGPGTIEIGIGVDTCDASPPPGVELNAIASSDFETKLDGWQDTLGGAIVSSDVAHCGLHSGRSSAPPGQVLFMSYPLPNPGTTTSYAFSAWARFDGASADRITLYAYAVGFDPDTGEVSKTCPGQIDTLAEPEVEPNTWTHLEATATVGGTGCELASIQVGILDSTDGQDVLLVDDAYAVPQ